jgi:large subunit ribosomal protein L25
MKISFELGAEFRNDQGKGASRRLRREGKVPAVLYGGKADPRSLSVDHSKLLQLLDNERFYSTILGVRIGSETQPVILKDVQRHPAKHAIVHIDLQRVVETEKIRIQIPLHFTGEAIAPGVKSQGGVVSHQSAEVEVLCLPKDLPEFIEVDVSGLSLNQSLHLSDLKLPQGVELVELAHGRNATVVSIHAPRAEEPEPTAAAAAEGAVAEGAPAAAAGAAPAGDAKKDEGKKDEKKEAPKKEGGKK